MNIFRVFDIGLLFLGAGYRSRKNVMSELVVKNNPQAIYSYENIFDIVIRNKLTAAYSSKSVALLPIHSGWSWNLSGCLL